MKNIIKLEESNLKRFMDYLNTYLSIIITWQCLNETKVQNMFKGKEFYLSFKPIWANRNKVLSQIIVDENKKIAGYVIDAQGFGLSSIDDICLAFTDMVSRALSFDENTGKVNADVLKSTLYFNGVISVKNASTTGNFRNSLLNPFKQESENLIPLQVIRTEKRVIKPKAKKFKRLGCNLEPTHIITIPVGEELTTCPFCRGKQKGKLAEITKTVSQLVPKDNPYQSLK